MAKTKGRAPRRAYLHALWSKVIRERDDYKCQVCGRSFRHETRLLEASHHIPRGMGGKSPAIACCLDNGSAKCIIPGGISDQTGCHQWMDRHPLQHTEWIQEFLGEERYERLKDLALNPPKMTDKDKTDLKDFLRETLKDLEARRRNGEMGRLEIAK